MKPRTFSSSLIALAIFCMSSAVVSGTRPSCAQEVDWKAAAGVGTRPDYIGGDDYEAVPIGLLRATWNEFAFVELAGAHGSGGAPRLRANIVADAFLKFGPLLQYRLGREDVEDDRVDALPEVDPALELGGFFGFEESGWNGNVSFAQDVSGEHDGFTVEVVAGYVAELRPDLTLSAGLASTYGSDGYMGAFFTVDSDSAAAAGLPAYDADGDFRDIGTELKLEWMFPGEASHFGLGLVFSYFHLLADAEDSPIVDDAGDPNQLFGGLMIVFRS
jgi:outer membrane scaffolding protein for murein synthesis (MipA/OmpV family)